MFSLDPRTQKITEIGRQHRSVRQKGLKAIPQGKSHANFVEMNGKLSSAHTWAFTHGGRHGNHGDSADGIQPYPGGHLLSYDLKPPFEDYGVEPDREGC
jgi:hypothetical protein